MRARWLFAAAALVVAVPAAEAGFKSTQWRVRVTDYGDGTFGFGGALGAARNSPDPNEYLVCTVTGGGASGYGGCTVRTGQTYRSCFTTDPVMLEQIQSLSDSSFVTATVAADGSCTQLIVGHASYVEPKQP